MTAEARSIDTLTPKDLETYSVWRLARGPGGDETCLRPVARLPVLDLTGKLVATRVTLANGNRPWALIGNVEVTDPRQTKHFVTISIEQDGRWFHLARYFDVDYASRGPQALAKFLSLQTCEVFPIIYDLGASVRGRAEATAGRIPAEQEERLTRQELIALAVPRRLER